MMQFFNSQERTIEDREASLRKPDPLLEVQEVIQPLGSNMSLIEAPSKKRELVL